MTLRLDPSIVDDVQLTYQGWILGVHVQARPESWECCRAFNDYPNDYLLRSIPSCSVSLPACRRFGNTWILGVRLAAIPIRHQIHILRIVGGC